MSQVDAFEETWGGRCYFQAYEFVENGADLQHMLDEEREQHERTKSAPTATRRSGRGTSPGPRCSCRASRLCTKSKIVHADLKPANAYLIKDPTIGAGYQLKLIDMDFSLLADRRAPWHGFQGYIGTDNYRSPEHLTRGAVPGLPSDVFTCGLMLLRASRRAIIPIGRRTRRDYARLVRAYAAKPPALVGLMPGPASNAEVSAALHRCLSPDPAARPTAAELRAILSGRDASRAAGADSVAERPTREPRPAVPQATAPAGRRSWRSGSNCIGPERARRCGSRVRTELGKALVRQFGPDGEFWDNRQCVIERSRTGNGSCRPSARPPTRRWSTARR